MSGGGVELQRTDSKTRDELKPGEFKVYLNDPEQNVRGQFPTNAIKTSKYNVVTFLPLNLIEQFQRLANVYFLLVVLIQFVPNVSPFSVWTSLLPLLFILAISAIKSAIEDWRRHRADARANSQCYRAVAPVGVGRTVPKGGIIKLASRDVRVGSILKIEKGEEFPADMIVLATSNPDSSCYENTSALDGEAVPKLRLACNLTMTHTTPESIGELRGAITLKQPTAALHQFEGRIAMKNDTPQSGVPHPLGVKQLVLRGSKLANTDWIYALVIYTGTHTKMMLNRNPTRFKFTRFEKVLNQMVIILFIFNLLLCVVAAIVCATSTEPWSAVYDLDDRSFVGFIYAFFTQYILFSFTIPLSLYVTIEIVKVGQAAFMEWDNQMRWISPADGKEHGMNVKASGLNEELGMIEYVFSDKTGTLTENEMELSSLTVAGTLCYMQGSAQHKIAVSKNEELGMGVPLTLHELTASVLAHGFDGTGTMSAEEHTATHFNDRPITAAVMSGGDIDVANGLTSGGGVHLQTVSAMISSGSSNGHNHFGNGITSLTSDPRVISVAAAGTHSHHHPAVPPLSLPSQNDATLMSVSAIDHTGSNGHGVVAPRVHDMPYPGPAISSADGVEPISSFAVRWQAPMTPQPRHVNDRVLTPSVGPRFHDSPSSPTSTTVLPSEAKHEASISSDPNFETWAHREFILSVLLCNSVLPVIEGEDPARPTTLVHSPVDADKRKYIFQSQSPDEIALVDAIHRCGVTFHRRAGPDLTLHLRLRDCDVGSGAGAVLPTPRVGAGSSSMKRSEIGVRVAEATYKVVAELEFTSARRRMSVVVQAPDGTYKLYVKGADAALFPLIDKSNSHQAKLVQTTDGHVTEFAGTGSRTLVFGGRTLPAGEFNEWFEEYNAAATALSGRDGKVEKAFTMIEKNLYLLGATAVEDHLQAGVPEAIDFMLKAKLKVVVLTGDKKETAVTIAKQCNLIRETARILYVNGNSMEETKASLDAAINTMAKLTQDQELLQFAVATPRSRAASSASQNISVAVTSATPRAGAATLAPPTATGAAPASSHIIPPSPVMVAQPSPGLSSQPAPITPIPLLVPSPAGAAASTSPLYDSKTLPVPATSGSGVVTTVGAAKEPSPHHSPQPSPHSLPHTAAAVPADGVTSSKNKRAAPAFALAIDGMAMEWCIVNYLAAYVALFRRCDTTVSYRSTPLQKAMAVKMAKKSLSAVCLAVGDGANDVSMIQESDVGVGIMGKEGSHAAMSADYVVLRFKHLLRLIFVHGRYSFYRTAKVCLFSFYKNTAFPTPTWYFQFYCLGTGQAFFDPFLMSGFNMFFSSLPPFVVGLLEKDLDEESVMKSPEAYDIFKKHNIFTHKYFFIWMAEAVYHSLVTWFIALGHFSVTDVGLKDGKVGGLWFHGDTVFAAGVILVNIQMFVNCRNITWFNPGAGFLGILAYFIMFSLISYSYWMTLAPDALGQMDYIYGSGIPYFYWVLALVVCFIPQAVIRCYMSLWHPDVTQQLHRQMVIGKTATPSHSPSHKQLPGVPVASGGIAANGLPVPPTPASRVVHPSAAQNNAIPPRPLTPSSVVRNRNVPTAHTTIPPSPIRAH